MRRPLRVMLILLAVLGALLFGLSRIDSSKPLQTMETDITDEANAL